MKAISSPPISKGSLVLFCVSAIVLIILIPFDQAAIYLNTYIACSVLVLACIICPAIFRDSCYSYCNPLTVISCIYGMLFGVCPIYDILTTNYLWYGYNLFENGLFATLVATIGYLIFVAVYACSAKEVSVSRLFDEGLRESSYTMPIIVAVYVLSFAANAYYMTANGGVDLLFTLSLGFLGNGGGEKSEAALGFISMFSYCLPAATLMIIEYGNSRILKAIAVYFMIALQVSRGFRFIIFEIAIMFLCYYYLKNRKMPNPCLLGSALFLLLGMVLFMTMFRNDIRGGATADLSCVDFSSLQKSFDEMFWDNLRIYKNFYGMVAAIPAKVPFAYLQQMVIATVVMVVPRAIWPGKPEHFGVGLDKIIGANFFDTGQAYPNLGEYWYSFGLVAVIFFMAIYGWWMKRSMIRFGKAGDNISKMALAVLISVNLQLIIRGYTPSNFWFVVFSIAPLYLIGPLCRLFDMRALKKKNGCLCENGKVFRNSDERCGSDS